MGCISYLCKFCGNSIKSDSQTGEGVKLFILQEGNLLEEKEGNYNSYGSTFDSPDWKNDWNSIISLHFNNSNKDGIAAIHTECWNSKQDPQIPNTISKDDRNQGWGKMKKSKTDTVNSKFYSYINQESIKKANKKEEDILDRLTNLLSKTESILADLKKHNKENKK